MNILDRIFGGGSKSNPMADANQYLNKIPGVVHKGYDDYINQGKDAGIKTKSQYEDLMNDPTGFINKIMEQYKESEGYGVQKDLLTKELGNTAAAGGIAGTPLDQMNQGQQVQKLLAGDMQQFLQNALGRYDIGLKGEEGIASRGYDASGKLTDALAGGLNQQGGLAFQQGQQKNSDRSAWYQSLAKALGLGVGAFTGGAGGALLGGGLGSNMFGGG